MSTKSYNLEGSLLVNVGKPTNLFLSECSTISGAPYLSSIRSQMRWIAFWRLSGLASLRLIVWRWLCGPNHLMRRSSCSVSERFKSRTVFRNVCFHPLYASGLSGNVMILVRRAPSEGRGWSSHALLMTKKPSGMVGKFLPPRVVLHRQGLVTWRRIQRSYVLYFLMAVAV